MNNVTSTLHYSTFGANETYETSKLKISKRDSYGFFCFHERKDMNRSSFIRLCLNREVMWLIPVAPHIPHNIFYSGLCVYCGIDMLIDTEFCQVFIDSFPDLPISAMQNPDLQSHEELDHFLDISHHIRMFLYIIAVPSVIKCIVSNKTLFIRIISLMLRIDFYIKSWIKCLNHWHFNDKTFKKGSFEQHFEHHISDIFDKADILQKVFFVLFHYGKRRKHLEWILSVTVGEKSDFFVQYAVIPFIQMMAYKDEIDACVDPPWEIYYFSIYASLLVFKYKHTLNEIKEWNVLMSLNSWAYKIMVEYYHCVLTIFMNKDNKMKNVYRQGNNYVNNIIEFRNRVSCNNPKCKINYYQHKYDTYFFSSKMWDSYGKPKRKWHRCKRCKLVYYCSRKCQKYDWIKFNHKETCNQLLKLMNS